MKYEEQINKYITPVMVKEWKKKRAERLDKLLNQLEKEDVLFLEQVKSWLDHELQENYQREGQ